jgi:hypothetical protein
MFRIRSGSIVSGTSKSSFPILLLKTDTAISEKGYQMGGTLLGFSSAGSV